MAWQTDYSHSSIEFSVRHMMISKARGAFEKFTVTLDADESNIAAASVAVQIEAASINTRDAGRDGHLKSPDFFDVATFPYITFKSSRVEQTGPETAKLYGDLTIRDVTKPLVLDVEYQGQSKSPWGTTNAGFTATTKFSRKDWNLTWNVGLETGGVLVGDEITLSIEVEFVQQVAQTTEAEVAA